VSLEVTLCNKLLVAVSTSEWSFPSVSPHMSLEVTSFGEFFQTGLIWADQNFLFIFWPLELLNYGYTSYKRLKVLQLLRLIPIKVF
jgi:hypothetical protein